MYALPELTPTRQPEEMLTANENEADEVRIARAASLVRLERINRATRLDERRRVGDRVSELLARCADPRDILLAIAVDPND